MRYTKAQKIAVSKMYEVTDSKMAEMSELYRRNEDDRRRFRLFCNRFGGMYFLCWQDTFEGFEYGISKFDELALAEGRKARKWSLSEAIPYFDASKHVGAEDEIK